MASPSSRLRRRAHHTGAFGIRWRAPLASGAIEAADWPRYLAAVACVRLLVRASLNCLQYGALASNSGGAMRKPRAGPARDLAHAAAVGAIRSCRDAATQRQHAGRRRRAEVQSFSPHRDRLPTISVTVRAATSRMRLRRSSGKHGAAQVAEGRDQVDELGLVLVDDDLFSLSPPRHPVASIGALQSAP